MTEGFRILDERKAEYADGFTDGAVTAVVGVILFGLIVTALWWALR